MKVAIKTIFKEEISYRDLHKVKNELFLLMKLDQPNICKYFEAYESPSHYYLVMEYCEGSELFNAMITKFKYFQESQARDIMRKILIAVNHCHTNHVIHRDLKPENIIIKTQTEKDGKSVVIQDLKIIDFGLGKIHEQKKGTLPLASLVGTSYYVAPEVIARSYGKECDCWSLGVIMYVILSGHLPFPG